MVDKEQLNIKRESLLKKLELLRKGKKEQQKLIDAMIRQIKDIEEEIAE